MLPSRILATALAPVFAVATLSARANVHAAEPLAARAAGQELTTERLASLIGTSPIGVNKRNVANAADLWVAYHLLAFAGANGDDLTRDTQAIDDAMWEAILRARNDRFYEVVRQRFPTPDSATLAARYARGNLLAAQHILFLAPNNGGMSAKKIDSIRLVAERVLRRATSANFAALARQYSEDAETKTRGGSLGIFPVAPAPDAMMPAFEAAVRALQPGQISSTLVRTPYGFHIVRRHLLSEVRAQFVDRIRSTEEESQRNAYVRKLRADYQPTFAPRAAAKIKAVAANETPDANKRDQTVIATTKAGPFTAARLAMWLQSLPQDKPLANTLAVAPDTLALRLVGELIDQEIFNAEALRQGVQPAADSLKNVRNRLVTMVNLATQGLRVVADSLRNEWPSAPERQELAAHRVDVAIDRIFATGGKDFVDVPPQLQNLLRAKYPSAVNVAALDVATARARAIRAAIDSTAPRKR